jgi:hypothetical protein
MMKDEGGIMNDEGRMMILVPRELLESLVSEDECSYDHHGGCQEHGYLSLAPGEMCPQAELKQILNREMTGASGRLEG